MAFDRHRGQRRAREAGGAVEAANGSGLPVASWQIRRGQGSFSCMPNEPSESDIRVEMERLRAENARLKADQEGGLRFKVSVKGAVSVYGLGRFPVTLYQEQWLRLLEVAEDVRAFIRDNKDLLKAKG